MTETAAGTLTRAHERILDAAERQLRQHGVDKLTVVDVARSLGMSHANVYRHFASKAALRDALVRRWLGTITAPLAAIAERPGPAAERLQSWFLALADAKRRKVLDDPELFAAYYAAGEEAREVIDDHLAENRRHLSRIVQDGIQTGEFVVADAGAAVTALRAAMSRFVEPHAIRQAATLPPARAHQDAQSVLLLLLAGLKAGVL